MGEMTRKPLAGASLRFAADQSQNIGSFCLAMALVIDRDFARSHQKTGCTRNPAAPCEYDQRNEDRAPTDYRGPLKVRVILGSAYINGNPTSRGLGNLGSLRCLFQGAILRWVKSLIHLQSW